MKKYISLISLLFSILFTFASFVYGTEVPKYEEYIVHAEVNIDKASGIYKYSYTLINPIGNRNLLWNLSIYISKSPETQELSWENLTYGKWYARHSSEANKDKVVPVGITGPQGWTYGIGEDEKGKGFVSFGNLDENEIRQGSSIRGLILTSHGLPGIRETILQPAIDYDNLPEEYWENVELSKQLRDSLIYHTKTIGPTAPPADFKPIKFLNYIINLKNEAYKLGWIKNKVIEKSLDTKLNNAKKKSFEI
ncbi:MAG: hypothetical protein HY752_03405 [Nitrospirae bacterium]|nr:hypothetical protein [Nitrospirota bacterium]